jgi:uncharacterized protein YeaO (DUF488 family)
VTSTPDVRVARVYEQPDPDGGARILVDRLWPRGLSKKSAALDEWCKEVAPSTELRHWYGHDPDKFTEFSERYRAELEDPERAAALSGLTERCRRGPVTLLTATKETGLSHAALLASIVADDDA